MIYISSRIRKRSSLGFTIVEIIVVIVVIGLLAVVGTVAYNNVTKQAATAELKSDAQGVIDQLAQEKYDKGTYPASKAAANNGNGLNHSAGTTLEYTLTGKNYCFTMSSVRAQISYTYDLSNGSIEEGVCPGHVGLPGSSGSAFAWTSMSADFNRACAITSGNVYCWGGGVLTPTLVGGLLAGKTATNVSVGYGHICAVADGKAYCWGGNSSGQLGNGTTATSASPVAVSTSGVLAGKTIASVSLGASHSCALTTDNVASCWGLNDYGQLGSYNTNNTSSPVGMTYSASGYTSPLTGKTITAISAGDSHTCAVASGAAHCWGANSRSQLGWNGTGTSYAHGAVTASGVLSGLTITNIDAGSLHTCAIASNARVYCWQISQYATTLNGTGTSSQTPVAVSTSGVLSGKAVTKTDGGDLMNCVVASGKVYCWGGNNFGQLGNSSTIDSFVPVAVTDTGALSGKTVTDVSVANSFACALAGGEIYCWGQNNTGQLGNGTTTQSTSPVMVPHP
jgi:alpha-tubulin suppressor-like RCC1 family protein/type II secretory pathway pseudopilin PulG